MTPYTAFPAEPLFLFLVLEGQRVGKGCLCSDQAFDKIKVLHEW